MRNSNVVYFQLFSSHAIERINHLKEELKANNYNNFIKEIESLELHLKELKERKNKIQYRFSENRDTNDYDLYINSHLQYICERKKNIKSDTSVQSYFFTYLLYYYSYCIYGEEWVCLPEIKISLQLMEYYFPIFFKHVAKYQYLDKDLGINRYYIYGLYGLLDEWYFQITPEYIKNNVKVANRLNIKDFEEINKLLFIFNAVLKNNCMLFLNDNYM